MTRKPDADPPTLGGDARKLKGRKLERAMGKTVASHRPAFQKCIEDASKKKTARTQAKATLLVTVRNDGVVSDAVVAEKGFRQKPLAECLVSASYRMSFPPFDGKPMLLRVPLRLVAQ